MSDIKIFVSHRIDQDSVTIDNPLFVPVRCGAVFDKRKNVEMLGDDTGDNISEKRETFCELTVQYWAWKNVKADYYGICHYKRYLSFSDEHYKTSTLFNTNGCVLYPYINNQAVEKFNLKAGIMTKKIEPYDLIVKEKINVPKTSPFKNVYDSIENDKLWHNIKDFNTACQIMLKKYPEFKNALDEYLDSKYTRMYSCFIMKKELFYAYNEWLFSILFELEPQVDLTYCNASMKRSIEIISEKLFGVYCIYLYQKKKYQISERQLVFFENTEPEIPLNPTFSENNIPIVLLSSNQYIPYVSVLLTSIMQNSSNKNNYDIIVFEKEISKSNKELLKQMINNYSNMSIRFYNPKNRLSDAKFYIASAAYCEEAYYRLLTPWILNNYEKAIVMDRDIANLYRIDVENVLGGAVKDIVFQGMLNGVVSDEIDYCKNEMKMHNPYNYVNTGVLLMNLKEFRSTYTEQYVIRFSQEHKFRIREQDILNVLMEDKIKFIDLKWNFYTETNPWIEKCLTFAPAESAAEYEKAEKDPYVIHYANSPKPWQNPKIKYAEEFWKVARASIYYKKIIARTEMDFSNVITSIPSTNNTES